MPSADPRSVRVDTIDGPFDQIARPTGVMSGDVLVVVVTSGGSINAIDVTGGNPWVQLDQRADPSFNTKVFGQVAGTTNPSTYAVETEGGGIAAIIHCRNATLAGMILASDGGVNAFAAVPCPPADGIVAGVEVRYVIGVAADLQPFGWFGDLDEEDQASDSLASAYAGAQTTLTSSDLPEEDIQASTLMISAWQSWTLMIPPSDYVPPPPPVPAFAVAGRALFRYTVHDMLTGAYVDDIYPHDPAYGKKVSEPGTFTGRLSVPNRKVAAAVRRVIPRLKSDLSTGPGRVQIRVWRDGTLAGRYWLTGARLSRGTDGKVWIDLRAVTLDGFWNSLRVRTDLSFVGNQIANARSLIQSAQAQAGANLGIQLQTGSSGSARQLLVKATDNTTYGRALQDYAKTSTGFEYYIQETVDETGVVSTWVWGQPTIDTGIVHVFSSSPHGGTIAEYGLEMDALRGGTDWQVRGGTEEGDDDQDRFPVMSNMVTTPHRAAGWPRIDRLVDDPRQSTDQAELDDLAEYYAEIAGGAMWVRTVTVLPARRTTLTMNSLGDTCRLLISDVWFEHQDGGAGLDVSERIIGIEVRPTGRGRGREEVVLTLASPEVP